MAEAQMTSPEARSIDTAPMSGDFLAFNAMIGWYRTRRTGDEFPLHGWDGKEGVWFPRPSHWMPLPARPAE